MSSFAERLKMFNKAVNENQNIQKPKFVKQNFQKNEVKKTINESTNQKKNNQLQTNYLNNKKEENNNNSNNNNNLNFGTSIKDRLKMFQQNEKANENKKSNINQIPKNLENKNILNNKKNFENNEKNFEKKIQNSNQNNPIQNNKPQIVSNGLSFQDRMKIFQNKKEEEKKIEPNIQKINKLKNQNIFEPTKKENNIKLEKPIINKNSNFQEKLKIMSQQQPSFLNNNNNDNKPKLIQNNMKLNVEKMLENNNNNNSDIKIEIGKFKDITEVYNEMKIVQNKKIPSKKNFILDDN